jgi:predicted nucleic acid-binding protein
MPDRLVLDASAALALVLRELRAQSVRAALEQSYGREVLVPACFWAEVVNVLVRRYRRSADEVVIALHNLDQVGLSTVDGGRPVLLLSIDLAVRHALSGYDAAYLALAEIADARLLTLDERLAVAAGTRAIPGPSSRPAETPVPYGPPMAAPDWSRHGRYLAELRRAVAGG